VTAPIDVSGAPVRRPGDGQTGLEYQPGLNRQNPPGGMGPWNTTNAGPVTVSFVGPWADGRMRALATAMTETIQYEVAAQGLADVQFILDRSIQFPTPYYETQIMIQHQADDWVVHDRGVVYGPWLESGATRRATSFRGYHAFRRAADELRRKAPTLIAGIATKFISRMQ